MKLFTVFITFVYTLLFLLIGGVLIAYGLHLQGLVDLSAYVANFKDLPNLGLSIIAVGFLIIVVNIAVNRAMFGGFQREKTIAFNNPNGEVSVSLLAIEDYIRRTAGNIREIKDIRAGVIAGKRGIEISARISLWSDTNIPEAADKIQSMIKNSVQEMLGIEEAINVKVHINKIAQRELPKLKKEEQHQPYKNIDYGRR